MDKFYCDGLVIRDAHGRQRIFRGVNICLKLKKASLSEARKNLLKKKVIKNLKQNGVNIVRLGITWAALEENRGVYSTDLAKILHTFVKRCEKEGIYVMPDMHQDLFSHYFHGDGAPDWAVDPAIKSKKQIAVWAEGYFYMNGVQRAFSDFWENKNGMQDDFIRCWKFLSDTFSDCSNIIGCDFFNEPFLQSGGREIFIRILNGVAETAGKNIDFHSCFAFGREKSGMLLAALKLLSVIRSYSGFERLMRTLDDEEHFSRLVDGNEKLIADFSKNYYEPFFKKISGAAGRGFNVFEHSYYSNLGIPFAIDTPDNSVYSPHAYDLFVDSPLYDRYCSNHRLDFILKRIRENQLRMQVPVIMGEWGGAQSGKNSLAHIDHIMHVFEQYGWSSIYWGMKFDDKKLLSVFNRPYPAAVFGDIQEMHTDVKEHRFTLVWRQNAPCGKYSDNANLIYIPGKGMVHYAGNEGENRLEIDYGNILNSKK